MSRPRKYRVMERGQFKVEKIPSNAQLFTGLKDFDGNDIYENDIVSFIGPDMGKRVCIVRWYQAGFYSRAKRKIGEAPPLSAPFIHNRELRVIGNITENPHILTERQRAAQKKAAQ